MLRSKGPVQNSGESPDERISSWMDASSASPWRREVDDTTVEHTVRTILEPLDASIDQSSSVLGFMMVFSIPVVLACLRWLTSLSWLGVFGVGTLVWIGVLIVIAGLAVAWDARAIKRAQAVFEATFPPMSPLREAAITILGEMTSPTDAEKKLLDSVRSEGRIRRVRRKMTGDLRESNPSGTQKGTQKGT